VNQNIAKSYDALVFANTSCGRRIALGELSQGLANYFELALHRRAEHRILRVIRERLARRELRDQLRRLRDIIKLYPVHARIRNLTGRITRK
jgi:hypothetical protein